MRAPYVFSLAAIATLAACEPGVPETQEEQLPELNLRLPDSSLEKRGSALELTLSAQDASSDEEDVGECLEWVTVEESYDEATGAFAYIYACPEGGDIAEQATVGQGDNMGNATYTQTLTLRDGTHIVWEYTVTLGDDGMSQIYDGTSNEGESHHSVQTYLADGSTHVDEVWNLVEGEHIIVGTYDEEGRFNGTSIFDDPNTEASPDYTLEHHENADGSFSQSVDGEFEGWVTSYTYNVSVDGFVDYDFVQDDLATAVSPDLEGSYAYDAEGNGTGSYVELLEDESVVAVVNNFSSDGVTEQVWSFDDAATALEVDQEGAMTYQADGSGEGTVTFHFEDGTSQTCDVTVAADGSSDLGECGA